MTVLAMILAHDKNGGIGKDNKIPWKCKSDIDFFWNTIGDHTVIVGRKTWESVKNYFLKRRPTAKHIIVTSKPDNQETENCIFVKSIEEALSFNDNLMFICGGSKVYDSVKNYVNVAIETVIDGEYECDSYAPKWLNDMTSFVDFDLQSNENQPKAHVYIRYWSK